LILSARSFTVNVSLCGGQKMAPHVNKWSPLDGARE